MKYTNECLIALLVDEYARTGKVPTHRVINGVQPSVITQVWQLGQSANRRGVNTHPEA